MTLSAKMPWLLSDALREILQTCVDGLSSGCIISFKDPAYSSMTVGCHPVEIMVNSRGQIHYIADFAYFGFEPDCVLVKELEFDFVSGRFMALGSEYQLEVGHELFTVWQSRFCSNHRRGIYNAIVEAI